MAKAKHRARAEARAKERKDALTTAVGSTHIKDLFLHAVKLAELVHGPGNGAQKRRFVVDLANAHFNIPVLNERTEQWVFDLAIRGALVAAKLIHKKVKAAKAGQ